MLLIIDNGVRVAFISADAHFASKNTLLKTHTLLLKSLTHFTAKNT